MTRAEPPPPPEEPSKQAGQSTAATLLELEATAQITAPRAFDFSRIADASLQHFAQRFAAPSPPTEPRAEDVVCVQGESVTVRLDQRRAPPNVYCINKKRQLLSRPRNLHAMELQLISAKPRAEEPRPPSSCTRWWHSCFTPREQPVSVTCARVSPCDGLLALGLSNNDALIVALEPRAGGLLSADAPRHLRAASAQPLHLLAWSPDSGQLAAAAWDQRVLIWDARTGQLCRNFASKEQVLCMVFHPRQPQLLATGTMDKMIQLDDVPQERVYDWLQTAEYPTALDFAPGGALLAAGFVGGLYALYKHAGKFVLELSGDIRRDFFATSGRGMHRDTRAAGAVVHHRSLWSILFRGEASGLRVRCLRFVSDEELLVMSNARELKLISAATGATLQAYTGFSRDSEPLHADFHLDKVLMVNRLGRLHLWHKISSYAPVFNPLSFPVQRFVNGAVEVLEGFGDHRQCFRHAEFLRGQTLRRWNELNPAAQADFLLLSVSADLRLFVDCQAAEE